MVIKVPEHKKYSGALLIALGTEILDRETLTELSAAHQVSHFNSLPSDPRPDICLVDRAHWTRVDSWLQSTGKHALRLLIVTPDELAALPQSIQEEVDDVLLKPVSHRELTIRLRNLMLSSPRIMYQWE